jgi:protein-S-isoprenylcysteine O-methyltransferase Ste14
MISSGKQPVTTSARPSIDSMSADPRGPANDWRGLPGTKRYDLLAALPLFAWYSLSAGRMVPAVRQGFAALHRTGGNDLHLTMAVVAQAAALLLVLMSMAFLMLRPPASAKAAGLFPRLAAFAGTYLGLAVVWLPRAEMSLTQSFSSLVLIAGGTAFTIYALFHLGRSFSIMAEARHLVTDGPYAVVRHPLYLGEAVSTVGLTVQFLSPLAVALTVLQLLFQLARMKNEERVLAAQFPEYLEYAARTPRLLPGVY